MPPTLKTLGLCCWYAASVMRLLSVASVAGCNGAAITIFLRAVSMAGCEGALGSPREVALSAARKFERKSYGLAMHFQYAFRKGI